MKREQRSLEKKLKDRGMTSVTSHALSRCLTGSGNALLCESLPAPPPSIIFHCNPIMFNPLSSNTESLFCTGEITLKMGMGEKIT